MSPHPVPSAYSSGSYCVNAHHSMTRRSVDLSHTIFDVCVRLFYLDLCLYYNFVSWNWLWDWNQISFSVVCACEIVLSSSSWAPRGKEGGTSFNTTEQEVRMTWRKQLLVKKCPLQTPLVGFFASRHDPVSFDYTFSHTHVQKEEEEENKKENFSRQVF